MLQNYNKYKILKLFFDNPLPEGGFQLREISRKAKLAPTSVKNYLKELEKEKLILKKKHRINNFPIYFSNRNNQNFRFYKKISTIITIKESSLLDYINDSCLPDSIILFGSAVRGEDIEGSDIDIFIQAKQTELNLKKYETELNRKINPFFEQKFNKLSKELKNNILNGENLSGFLKIF